MVKGLDKVLAMLDRKEKEIREELAAVVKDQTEELKEDTRLNANSITYEDLNGNLTYLPNKIHSRPTQEGHEVIVNADNMAAYIEFGTGHYAAMQLAGYPGEWKDIAMQFYVNGTGTTNASPYLYPAYVKRAPEFIRKAKEGLIAVCRK